ncbi:nucleotidyltransferase-like protein [Paraliobacillus sp. JSM ZJ581]|uniref:nucleotidyltransferase-like protein n=1 Tax=Paraliobacillus sp. JSM ZJ581 TaxID=3342118 RepID=UPI0035A88C90
MDDVWRPIYQERASNTDTLGVLIYEKKKRISPVTDNFDVILLVVVTEAIAPWYVKHYQFKNKTAAMHIVEEQLLNYWIDTSSYRRVFEWIINGTILFERNKYIAELKEQLEEFPLKKRQLKLAMEFAKLTRNYSEAKDLFLSSHYLDAFSKVLSSLHSLGRLSIIEQGYHPEVIAWNQIKQINPEVYKLYEELVQSEETVEKRVELMLFAIDLSLWKHAELCAAHLLDVIRTTGKSWSFGELKVHPSIRLYELDLSTIIDYLVAKEILEVEHVETKGKSVFHRKYRVKE